VTLRVINRHDMAELISMPECIVLMRQAFVLVSQGRTIQPIRQGLVLPSGRGVLSLMPGQIDEPACFGIKVVSVFPGNHGTAYGSHQGAVLLFDDETGALKAVLDGRDLTALRTAAASAAATDVLARQDARTLTIYGYGDEAESHLRSLTLVRDFERITICGRSAAKAQAFAGRMSEALGRVLDFSNDIEASADADVVTTVTAADEPYLLGRFIKPGTHLNIVGSSIPTAAEIDDSLVAKSRFYTDYTASTLELGGEIRSAIERGAVTRDHILGCVGDVMTGKVEGRRNDADITLFKSLGMAAEDLVCAATIFNKAEIGHTGVSVDW
jgi:ornithine cyclodeaminase/alanine dehydrogenase-like protein (mu-crystallin family)